MVEKDPFLNFISDLSEKIKISKEHKQIMERVNDPKASIDESKASLDNLILTIKEKIESTVTNRESVPVLSTTQITPLTSNIIKVVSEEENNFQDFVGKLKGILAKPREISEDKTTTSSISLLSASPVKSEEQEDIKKYVNVLNQPKTKKNKNTQNYVEELEKIKDGIQIEKEDTKVTEIKKLIEEYAEKYIKKAVGMMGESGGGTNAVQYANGGTMNGDLNLNGNYLSGGVNLLDIFALQPDLDRQTLSFNNANYDLSISGGNTVNLSAINTTFQANSGKYESNYTTTELSSAYWAEAYTNLTSNSAAYLSAVDISLLAAASGSWNSNYTTVSQNSAYWADIRNNVTFEQNVTIQGNLTALGTSTFQNTVFTTTSALSVVNLGPGPALYVYQAAGPYDVASFYDGDGVEVLHVGNAQGGGNPLGQVGINTSFPSAELTVNGAISSNGVITVLGGNSNQWNSAYTNISTLSAPQLPVPKIILGEISSIQYLSGYSDNFRGINTLRLAGVMYLHKSPRVIVNDITLETLNSYQIFIEMVQFRKTRKSKKGWKAAYKVPIDSRPDLKPWGTNFWQRSGSEPQYNPLPGGFVPHVPLVLRHNQLPVTSPMQVIDLSPCLNGRFREADIQYSSDPTQNAFNANIKAIAPFMLLRKGNSARLGYSNKYQAMYVAFRYIAWLPNSNNGRGEIVSGPLSPTIRISNLIWPFQTNHYASSVAQRPIVNFRYKNDMASWSNAKTVFNCNFV